MFRFLTIVNRSHLTASYQSNVTGQILPNIKTIAIYGKQNQYQCQKQIVQHFFSQKAPKKIFTHQKKKSNKLSLLNIIIFLNVDIHFPFIPNRSNKLHLGQCKSHNQNPVSIPHFLQEVILYQNPNPKVHFWHIQTNHFKPVNENPYCTCTDNGYVCYIVFDINHKSQYD